MKGSIKKYTAKDGATSYRVTFDLPPDPVTGRRRQRRLTAPTKRQAEDALTRELAAIQGGAYVQASSEPLREYLPRWLKAAAPSVRPTTVRTYRIMIDRHLKPALGNVTLKRLTPSAIQSFYAEALAGREGRRPLSPTTVGVLHAVLHRALGQAVKWRLLAHNPADGLDVPRPARPEMAIWTVGQARTFLTRAADDDLAALWRLAISTGMRRGELLALTWDDIDLARGAVAVRRTLTRAEDGALTTGEPKSASGRRSIAVPAACVAALKRHRARQVERMLIDRSTWQETGLVFDRGDGGLMVPNAVSARFIDLAKEFGLPRIRFHDLRHTAATLMLGDGIHPKVVQERLGHGSVSMTLDRYSHVSMSMQQDAADRLERLLGA